eukprot:TRINITY_DN619_c0_g1_i1.p1 TRINITY_DN619_c0_g1~~TRINITY_DN619_c0_g1_i1.p1  ORF type:complete len:554 (+),score=199.42 TRINITY_DN619_c0_g1_i1:14-1675(+)
MDGDSPQDSPPESRERERKPPKKGGLIKSISFWRRNSKPTVAETSKESAKSAEGPASPHMDSRGNETTMTSSSERPDLEPDDMLGEPSPAVPRPKANTNPLTPLSPNSQKKKPGLFSPRTREKMEAMDQAASSQKKKADAKKKAARDADIDRDPLGPKKKYSKDSREEEEVEEHTGPIYANCVKDLPEELRRKIAKAKIDDDKLDENFEVLCNVLRFTTKKNVIKYSVEEKTKEEKEKEKGKKRHEKNDPAASNISPELLKASESTITYGSPKKFYKKAEFTGKGGFGRVYYAKTVKDKSSVAIKKMPFVTPKEKRMNLDEIAVLNYCNHPNIVKYHRSFVFEDETAVVMEYMEGGSLSEAVKTYSFEESHIAYVAQEMLNGIIYLHKNNLVHRDLKSANVMLTTRGDVKLIDFGLTVDISRCRLHMVGSPFWMPPEMVKSEPHGFPADIWSFAICLIEMADKKPPHRKARIKAMFLSATEGLMPYVEEQTKYSEDFKNFLEKCLQVDPTLRSTPEDLLKHKFLTMAASKKDMESVLKEIFITNAFENSGLFM